MVLDGGNIIPT